MRRTGLLQLVPALALFVGGCADPATITIEVTTGHESDTFSMDPAVTKVDVVALASDGSQLAKATSEPGGSFDIGEVPIDQFLRVEVTGSDADGQVRVRGRSIGLVIGALQGELLPVFAQRLERWSRPPGALTHSHVGGIGGVLGERFLMLTGGSGIDADASAVAFYDLLALGGSVGGSLSLVPKSMIVWSVCKHPTGPMFPVSPMMRKLPRRVGRATRRAHLLQKRQGPHQRVHARRLEPC